jgi:hypothetical protein
VSRIKRRDNKRMEIRLVKIETITSLHANMTLQPEFNNVVILSSKKSSSQARVFLGLEHASASISAELFATASCVLSPLKGVKVHSGEHELNALRRQLRIKCWVWQCATVKWNKWGPPSVGKDK